MLSDFAVPDTVGFVGFSRLNALRVTSFLAASATIFTSASRVSGFFVSIPGIHIAFVSCVQHLIYKSVGMNRVIYWNYGNFSGGCRLDVCVVFFGNVWFTLC